MRKRDTDRRRWKIGDDGNVEIKFRKNLNLEFHFHFVAQRFELVWVFGFFTKHKKKPFYLKCCVTDKFKASPADQCSTCFHCPATS